MPISTVLCLSFYMIWNRTGITMLWPCDLCTSSTDRRMSCGTVSIFIMSLRRLIQRFNVVSQLTASTQLSVTFLFPNWSHFERAAQLAWQWCTVSTLMEHAGSSSRLSILQSSTALYETQFWIKTECLTWLPVCRSRLCCLHKGVQFSVNR